MIFAARLLKAWADINISHLNLWMLFALNLQDRKEQ